MLLHYCCSGGEIDFLLTIEVHGFPLAVEDVRRDEIFNTVKCSHEDLHVRSEQTWCTSTTAIRSSPSKLSRQVQHKNTPG